MPRSASMLLMQNRKTSNGKGRGEHPSRMCMLRSLGAPVMDPPGKVARRHFGVVTCGRRCPRTVLTRLCTA